MGWYLEIIFKDGRTMTLRPSGGETDKALRQFKEREPKIEILTMEGGPSPTIISTSEIKALRPYFVKGEKE